MHPASVWRGFLNSYSPGRDFWHGAGFAAGVLSMTAIRHRSAPQGVTFVIPQHARQTYWLVT